MTTNGYTPETARTAYFPGSTNALARLWSREKTLHDWDDMGAVTFFEGPGDNPTSLPGYSISKLWLRTTAGVTTTSGTIRFYTGGDATLLASWPELTKAGFASHLGARGGSLDFVWSAATSGDPGPGYVLANHATLASATAINISKTGRGGQSYGSLLATWDDSTTASNKGTLALWGVADDGAYFIVQVTGAATDNSTYYTFPVTVKASGTLAAGQLLGADFSRVGDGASVTSVDGNIGDVAVNNAKPVATRTALKALDTTKYTLVYLTESGREGIWFWKTGDYAARITADVQEGLFVKATAIASSAGSWVRGGYDGTAPAHWFGTVGGTTNDRVVLQQAIDTLSTLGGGTLWLDQIYTVSGLHSNGLSVLELKSGVHIDGPGGFKLADNSNVLGAEFTASIAAGGVMTVTAVASGTLAVNQFLTATDLSPPYAQISSQISGTTGGVGTYQTNAGALSSRTIRGASRFVEIIGAYGANAINDTTYRNFTIDYNGVNNCASGTIWTFNAVACINTGRNVVFDGITFKNNCGSNTFVLGTYQATPYTMFNCIVRNCIFDNDGDRINPVSHDYSTIFAFADGLSVTDNAFARGPSTNGAAFEVYGENINISGNTVSGYYNTANIVAISGQTTENVNFTGNTIHDCGVGITLWAFTATSKLWGINISGNTFTTAVSAPGGPYMVSGIGQVHASSDLRNITIENNTFQNFDITDTARTTDGISLQAVYSAKISNNVLWGIPGRGIYLTGTYTGGSFEITNNSMLNVGYTADADVSLKNGITCASSIIGPASSLVISGNTINPIGGYTLTTGIKGALNTGDGYVGGNIIVSATTPLDWTGTGMRGVTYALPRASGFNNAAGYAVASYMKDENGTVLVQGAIDMGTISGATTIATLPAGYRPQNSVAVPNFNLTTDVAAGFVVANTGVISQRGPIVTSDRVSFSFAFRAA